MGIEGRSESGLEAVLNRQELMKKEKEEQEAKMKEMKEKIDNIGSEVRRLGENIAGLPQQIAPPPAEEKTVEDFSAQEKYDSIMRSLTAKIDLDGIYRKRFKEDADFRKFVMEEVCPNGVCRVDTKKMIEEWEKTHGKKEKKLL